MLNRDDLLKSIGFSDEFIHSLNNPRFIAPTISSPEIKSPVSSKSQLISMENVNIDFSRLTATSTFIK